MCFSPTGALAFPERGGGEGGMGIFTCLFVEWYTSVCLCCICNHAVRRFYLIVFFFASVTGGLCGRTLYFGTIYPSEGTVST